MQGKSGFTAKRVRWMLAFLWLAFVARGAWYAVLLPPWEGYDEPYHFAAIQHVASGQGLPQADTPISLEVQKSLHLLPVPWELPQQAVPGPLTTDEAFWSLPAGEQEQRLRELGSVPATEGSLPATEPILNYESQQAPVYYWLMAAPMRALGGQSLLTRIFSLRLLSVVIASLLVPLAYWIALTVFRSAPRALGATAVMVLLPELMVNLARVGNECIAVLAYSALLIAALKVVERRASWRWWLALGASAGIGLLVKAYFLSAIPALGFVLLASLWLESREGGWQRAARKVLPRAGVALAIVLVLSSSWYWSVHEKTGSWSGQGDDAALRNVGLLEKLSGLAHVNWRSAALSVLISHTWFGGWSFLRVPDGLYVAAFAIILSAMAGFVVRFVRRREAAEERRDISVLSAFYLSFWAGLAYHVLVTFLHTGLSVTTGWYLYAAVAGEVVLLTWGLGAIAPYRIVFTGLVIGLAALDLYGVHAVMMPYYSGLTAHVGKTAPAALGEAVSHVVLIFTRMAMVHPVWLGNGMLVALWVGYWVATAGVAVGVIMTAGQLPGNAD